LADEIGMPCDRLRHYMESGKVPYPEVRILRRAYFRREQANAIKNQVQQLEKESLAPNGKTK